VIPCGLREDELKREVCRRDGNKHMNKTNEQAFMHSEVVDQLG